MQSQQCKQASNQSKSKQSMHATHARKKKKIRTSMKSNVATFLQKCIYLYKKGINFIFKQKSKYFEHFEEFKIKFIVLIFIVIYQWVTIISEFLFISKWKIGKSAMEYRRNVFDVTEKTFYFPINVVIRVRYINSNCCPILFGAFHCFHLRQKWVIRI